DDTGALGVFLGGVADARFEANRILRTHDLDGRPESAVESDTFGISCNGSVDRALFLRNRVENAPGAAINWQCSGVGNTFAENRISGSCREKNPKRCVPGTDDQCYTQPDVHVGDGSAGSLVLVDDEVLDSGCAAPFGAELPKPQLELLIRGGRYEAGPLAMRPVRFQAVDVILERKASFSGAPLEFGEAGRALGLRAGREPPLPRRPLGAGADLPGAAREVLRALPGQGGAALVRDLRCAGGEALSCARGPERGQRLRRAGDEEVLGVPQPSRPPDLLATRVVDPDLRADVALVAAGEHAHLAARAQQRLDLAAREEALVAEREHQHRRAHRLDDAPQAREALAARVEGAAPLAAVDAFAGGAVDLGLVPEHERFPDVVVPEVGVLVVGRVEVGDVGAQARGGQRSVEPVCATLAGARARLHVGQAQL